MKLTKTSQYLKYFEVNIVELTRTIWSISILRVTRIFFFGNYFWSQIFEILKKNFDIMFYNYK